MPRAFRYGPGDEIEMYWAEQCSPRRHETIDTSVLDFQRDLENNNLKVEQIDFMWNQHRDDLTPSSEEMETERGLEQDGLPLLWFQTDFRELVRITLIKE